MPPFAWRAIRLQIGREAIRQVLALRTCELAAVQGSPGRDAGRAGNLRDEIRALATDLRMLAAADDARLQQIHARSVELLKRPASGAGGASGLPPHPRPADMVLPAPERLRIFDELIRPALLPPPGAHAVPQAVVFGAHLGCGKARAMEQACLALGGPEQAAVVMLEDLRPFHPRYAPLMAQAPRFATQYTDPDVLCWADMAVQAALGMGAPLVLDAGMRSAEKIVRTFGALERAGYDVEARALAVPHAVSWQTILTVQELSRQEFGLTRTITAAAHEATFDGLLVMLEHVERRQLASRVTVHDRFGECRYAHDVRTGRKDPLAPSAATVLRIERALPLPLPQLRGFHATYAWLERAMSAAGREASPGELLQVEGLRRQSHGALLAQAFLELPEQEGVLEFPELAEAFAILADIRSQAESLPPRSQALLVKKAAAGIAQCLAQGELARPFPW